VALLSGAWDRQSGTVTIRQSKSGKPRHVALTDEGREFFESVTAGKVGNALLFERDWVVTQATREAPAVTQRAAWSKSDQFRLIRAASIALHSGEVLRARGFLNKD
jgi:hypothetical protein